MSSKILSSLILLALPIGAQQIVFKKVDPAKIEKRLAPGAEKSEDRGEALQKLFEEAGCKEKLTVQPVKGSKAPNVICTLNGSGQSVIVIGARFDKPARRTGVVDNWNGAALLPSLYESLCKDPRRTNIVFVGFADDEKSTTGSKFYVGQLSGAERSKIKAMVNIESVGLSASKIWIEKANKNLLNAAGRVASSMKLPISGTNLERVSEFDSKPFADKSIPTIDIHSLNTDSLAALQGESNKPLPAVNMDEYRNTYSLLVGYVAFLDLMVDPGAPASAGQ